MSKKSIRLYVFLMAMESFGVSFIFTNFALFLKANGLNLFETNLVNTAYFVTLFLCEIPTGAIADVFGRKLSYVIACVLHGVSWLTYSVSSTMTGFIVAEIIGAVGMTCASGAFQAWLVDSLKHYGHTDPYMPILARAEQVSVLVGIVGAFIGSAMFEQSISLPWLAGGIVIMGTGVIAQISMREDYFVRTRRTPAGYWSEFKNTIVRSVSHARSNNSVRFLLFSAIFQVFAIQAPNMQWPLRFSELTGDKKWLPYVYTGIAVCLFLGYSAAKSLSPKIRNEKSAINVIQLITGIGIASAGLIRFLPAALTIFFVHELARGTLKPVKDAYLNDNIPSSERATLISFEGMSAYIGGAIGLLLSGILAECVSIPFAWLVSGATLGIAAIVVMKNGKS